MPAPSRPAAPRQSTPLGVVRLHPTTADNAALLRGLRAGEPWARAAFFDRFAPQVQRLMHRLLGPRPRLEVPDLVHDVFVKALASIEQLRAPEAMHAWMSTIATRAAFRAIRAERARRWLRFWEPEQVAEVASPEVDDDVLDAYRRTYAVLDRMPAEERVVFALRYLDRMELAPMADACDVSLATVKRRLARAEQRFAAAARRDEVLRGWLEEGDRWTT